MGEEARPLHVVDRRDDLCVRDRRSDQQEHDDAGRQAGQETPNFHTHTLATIDWCAESGATSAHSP